MKKFHILTTGLFLGIIVLILIAGTNLAAQVKLHKKPAADEATWAVRIPADSTHLMGMDSGTYIYEDEDPAVAVMVSKGDRAGVDKTFIKFFIYQNDGSEWASMPNVVFEEGWITDTGEPCGFPPPYNSVGLPYCISEFMGGFHPYPGYEHIMIMFDIYNDIEDETLFPIGIPVTYTGPSAIAFYIWNNTECDNPDRTEPWYHTVSGRITYPPDGFIITRLNENTWRLEVFQLDFPITESYCYEEPGEPIGKSGKYQLIHESFSPFTGVANLSFALEIIKNNQ
jgi:hypothetical protein